MMFKRLLLVLAFLVSISSAFATVQVIPKALQDIELMQRNESRYVLKSAKGSLSITPENWFNLSPADGVEGVRTEETYVRFGLPQSEDIIVAVIDSGVDVNHEDLQGKIWINEGEIPNNGIDDDGNGYVDDVFGWNFIGGLDGMATVIADDTLENGIRLIKGKAEAQVDADTLEITRELVRMKKLRGTLPPAQAEYLKILEATVSSKLDEAKGTIETYTKLLKKYKDNEAILRAAGVRSINIISVRAVNSDDPVVVKAREEMLNMLSSNQTENRLSRVLDYYNDQVAYYYNENFDSRTIVGDNYADQNERFYGNNDVIGPDSSHGTHVSGSIAAVRDNGIGIKGVATNVKIMAIRVVPNGDERDKDVANGIRYAVDNGAKIINMSFGKNHSPYKNVVDDAVRYAESKGVLLVHAAGNDSKNNDLLTSYPSRYDGQESRDFVNWLEIGASSYKKGLALPARFSNYGKQTVDFFAPGVDILSTTPNNGYDTYSGTSMASPTVAGVAALALSFDPLLNAEGVKSLLIETSREYRGLEVNTPGTQDLVLFESLSTYGTIVDAFEAVDAIY
jgi:subtilisin family serine protease